MACDFLSDADNRYFGEGMLHNDDWGDPQMNTFDDFPSFLDDALNPDDLMKEFNTGIEIPMFDDHNDILGLALREENVLNRSSSSDSGIAGLDTGQNNLVKHEPLSPASSFSSDSDSAGSNTDCQLITHHINNCIKFESPPLTPPRDPNDIIAPVSIHNFSQSNHSLTTSLPTTQTKIKTEPVSDIKTQQILNNKIKIVPRPPVTSQCLTTNLQNGTPSNPLVLTPDEFARLTSQGVLKFKPPVDVKPFVKGVSPVTTQVTGTAPNSALYPAEPTMRVMKRQQRMIKNRESACLSRRRKKEYVQSLEERMKQFNDENDRLKHENLTLKQQVDVLQQENEQLRKTVPLPSKRTATTFLLAIMLFFSLNMGPISNILVQSPEQSITIPTNEIHHGRSLLSIMDEKSRAANSSVNQTDPWIAQAMKRVHKSGQNSSDYKEMLMKSLEKLSAFTLCPSHFNRSESLRLANELTGWVLGHKSEMKQKEAERAQKRGAKFPKRYRPLKVLKAAMEGRLSTQLEKAPKDRKNYQIQLYNAQEKSYNEFLDSIQRRNDTFYVVSFRRDHLLLPATAHNKTMRPRMSLVMPAVNLNDTMQPPIGSVAMMQIDCEVMDTKLIHVTKSTVPKYMWEANSTMPSAEEKDVSEDDGGKYKLRYKPRRVNP